MATVTLAGNPIEIAGELPVKGTKAPGFTLTGGDFTEKSLRDFKGKKKVLNIVHSLDTSICATSARKFNVAINELDDTVLLNISADLPFAAGRFCAAEGLENVVTLSTFRSPSFLKDWGIGIIEGARIGLTARAVVVLDAQDQVIYTELVPEIAQEPNYEAALAALKAL